ncbi:MAG TPA: hypothetical protein VNM72_15540 [Blastocatellia bacterium]|nr:hypothetical protein [Blastocatellia bacterium]
MRYFREVVGQELMWVQPKRLTRRYELRVGEDVLATLQWQEMFGSLAVAESADGQWTLKRSGFLRARVTIRVAGSDCDSAVFVAGWWGNGILEFLGGPRFIWKPLNFWRSEWAWTGVDGALLLRVKRKFTWTKVEGRVQIEPTAGSVPQLSLLAILGWYLVVILSS